MICPCCHHDADYKVLPVKYDKTPKRMIRTVKCLRCGEEYYHVISVWNGDCCPLDPKNIPNCPLIS